MPLETIQTQYYHDNELIVHTFANHGKQLVINRPKQLNAIPCDMFQTIEDLLLEWLDDSLVPFVLMTGSKMKENQSFCSGGDLKEITSFIAGEKMRAIGTKMSPYSNCVILIPSMCVHACMQILFIMSTDWTERSSALHRRRPTFPSWMVTLWVVCVQLLLISFFFFFELLLSNQTHTLIHMFIHSRIFLIHTFIHTFICSFTFLFTNSI